MLTRRGWTLVGAAIGLYFGARIVGLGQLDVLATTCIVLIIASLTWAGIRTIDVTAERAVPERLTVGTEGRVDLSIRAGGRSTPTLLVTDHFDRARRAARFRVGSLSAHTEARAAYRIPTERRGRYELGPLHLAIADPFGIARRSRVLTDTQEVLVYPRVHDLVAPPEVSGYDLDLETRPSRREHASGSDFAGLREYQLGDDLRRVHWRSTARRDEVMLRQDETRRRAPTLVFLDVRSSAHDVAGFERAVCAAASIVRAVDRAGRECELVDSTGRVIGNPGRRHFESVMDHLAVVNADGPPRFAPALSRRQAPLLVAILGRANTVDHRALGAMVTGMGRTILVDTASPQARTRTSSRGRRVVPAGDDESLVRNWNELVLQWHGNATRTAPPRLSAV